MGVKVSGPLFERDVGQIVDNFLAQLVVDIANQGVNDVKMYLDGVLQNPTGNYERHIRTERQQNDMSINDSNIIYGPWLEGIGSRNETTRFKGYFTFRTVCQRLDAKAFHMSKDMAKRLVGRLG